MGNDADVLYDSGTTATSDDDKGDVLYDPAAIGKTAPAATPPPITAPKFSDFIPDSQTIPNLASGAAEGTENLGKGILNTVLHPIDTLKNAAHTIGQSYDLAKSGQYVPAIATAAGVVGFDEPRLAQLWNQGQGSRAVGEAAPMAVADALALKSAPDAARSVKTAVLNPSEAVKGIRETAARAGRTPDNKLRPVVSIGSRVAGAGLGHATGIPEGALIGAFTGRSVADALIPKRPFEMTPQLYDQARNAMYTEKGNALMKRGKEQTAIEKAQPQGSERVAGTRSLILTPEEASSESQIQRMAKQRASERGMQFAAGMTPREGRAAPRFPQAVMMPEWSGVRERLPMEVPDEEEAPEQ